MKCSLIKRATVSASFGCLLAAAVAFFAHPLEPSTQSGSSEPSFSSVFELLQAPAPESLSISQESTSLTAAGAGSGGGSFIFQQITNTPLGERAIVNAITPDGRFLVVTSTCNLQPGGNCAGGIFQVFRYDRQDNTFVTVTPRTDHALGVAISTDGSKVVFLSFMNLAPPDDVDGSAELFLWDQLTGIQRITSSPQDVSSEAASLSADATKLVFIGKATTTPWGPTRTMWRRYSCTASAIRSGRSDS